MGILSQWFNRTLNRIKGKPINIGTTAELKAEKYLTQRGLKLVARNYRSKAGEIDLIMSDQQFLIFVEVRYKRYTDWASPAESVTYQKQRKIIKAAKQYLLTHDPLGRLSCRFDVVAMTGKLQSPEIEWLPHAFY